MTITIGSLFAGIGGLELGLERAGLGPVLWQVERDAFCRSVLAKHWPTAERIENVQAAGIANLRPVDLICGGFPCQDLSIAGKGAGLAGDRSGLWSEYARIVREIRPRFVVVENVSALRTRGLGVVLGDLAAVGYDAWWCCISASAIGAPHRRDRLFIIAAMANPGRDRLENRCEAGSTQGTIDGENRGGTSVGALPVLRGIHLQHSRTSCERMRVRPDRAMGSISVSVQEESEGDGSESVVGRIAHGVPAGLDRLRAASYRWPARPNQPPHEWEAPRLATGVTRRAARLRSLGNAVVPQVAEVIGNLIVALAKEGA